MLPKFLNTLLPKFKTPFLIIISNALIVLVLLLLPLQALLKAEMAINAFTMISLFVVFIVLRIRDPGTPRGYRVPLPTLVCILVALLPIGICIWSVITTDMESQIAGLICLSAGCILYPLFCFREVFAFVKRLLGKCCNKHKTSEMTIGETTSLLTSDSNRHVVN